MQHLRLNLYRAEDVMSGGYHSLDLAKFSTVKPVDRVLVKARILFGVHLEHLAFLISRRRPDLSGFKLDVTLELRGDPGHPQTPVMTVFDGDACVSRYRIHLNTLDTGRILSVVHRKHPALKTTDLFFTLDKPKEGFPS